MLLLEPPPQELLAVEDDEAAWPVVDAIQAALALLTVWAARTGRVLPDVPITEMSPQDLEDFWADDQLEEPYITNARCWLPQTPVLHRSPVRRQPHPAPRSGARGSCDTRATC